MSHFKQNFPLFDQYPGLVYLDTGATSLKPRSVIAAERSYEETLSTNVGRGLYPLAEEATERFEAVRGQVARFIGAQDEREIIFTSGTTASLNLAASLLEPILQTTDNIITTTLEHHSNFLPWAELARRKGRPLRLAPFTESGTIDTEALLSLVDSETKIVALSALSNVFGIQNPVTDIVRRIRAQNPNTLIIIDAAQMAGHLPVNVTVWDADLVAFSGHKMYGPTGTGILYGKHTLLETYSPTVFGGGMVLDACASPVAYKASPYCFEAGTPNISGVLGLGAAITFLQDIGFDTVSRHEHQLMSVMIDQLQQAFGTQIHILGDIQAQERSGIISFTLDGLHPHDLAQVLGEKHVCIRAGEHCAAPLHRTLGLPATARVSLGMYNTEEDIQTLIETIRQAQQLLHS